MSATILNDDASTEPLPAGDVAWTIVSGPLQSITGDGEVCLTLSPPAPGTGGTHALMVMLSTGERLSLSQEGGDLLRGLKCCHGPPAVPLPSFAGSARVPALPEPGFQAPVARHGSAGTGRLTEGAGMAGMNGRSGLTSAERRVISRSRWLASAPS